MIKKVHEHILGELQQSARIDTIFVVTAVLFNLIVLAINSAVAGNAVSKNPSSSDDFVLTIFIIMSLIVNSVAITALLTGKNTRKEGWFCPTRRRAPLRPARCRSSARLRPAPPSSRFRVTRKCSSPRTSCVLETTTCSGSVATQ